MKPRIGSHIRMIRLGIDLYFIKSVDKSRERQIKKSFDVKEMGSLSGSFRFRSHQNRWIIMPDASSRYFIFMIFQLSI